MCGNDDGGGRGSGVDRWSDDDDDGVVGDEGVVVMMYGGGCRRRMTGIIGRKRGGAEKEEEGGRRELHYLLAKVVSVGSAPGTTASDHNVNLDLNGDGMPRMRTFRETIFPE
ncbi:hypothetical protein Tco_0484782 [Tanacetum coccineum]